MNIDNYLEKYNLEEVFNHDEYIKYMESKIVRDPRTGTLLDFITEEQEKSLKEQSISDLSIFDPTPKEIQEHMDFTHNVYIELNEKLPSDDFIKFIGESEEGCIVMVSTNWYEKYGFAYSK